jgi:hypothetical protein
MIGDMAKTNLNDILSRENLKQNDRLLYEEIMKATEELEKAEGQSHDPTVQASFSESAT